MMVAVVGIPLLLLLLLLLLGKYYIMVAERVVPPTTQHFMDTSNTSRPSCQCMFTVRDKAWSRAGWNNDQSYEELSRQLPRLLVQQEENITKAQVYMDTRLASMRGAIPYLPCKVRRIRMDELRQCVAARTQGGTNTWIAFVGDSNMRQKFHTFISLLPTHLHYTYYLGQKQVSREEFIAVMMYHMDRPPTFDIIGRVSPLNTTTQKDPQDSSKASLTSDISNYSTTHQHHRLYRTDLIQNISSIDAMYAGENINGTNWKENQSSLNGGNPLFVIPSNISPHSPSLYDPLLEDAVVLSGGYELRVTLVWSTGKKIESRSKVKGGRTDVAKLEEWLEGTSIPHVIVIG
ncbi:hypothetical protein Pcinc_026983 [Petrolisthes cinctipes]|uniref:Uncharacterized protein n=1 Tax=Petrolisthes cinctipes TaxID=88211 RepID=A0AAE1F5A1_PETCI|nr:hypothetical protein Pcinc_026983 [Petrolisthes cinctipes]